MQVRQRVGATLGIPSNMSPARVRCLNIRTTSLLVVIDDDCDGAGGFVQAEVESLRQQLLSLQKDRAGRLGELEKQAADLAFTSKVCYTAVTACPYSR